MEFPKNKPAKEGVNRKEQVYLEVLEKYCVISKFVGNRFEQGAKQAMDNQGEDLASQNIVSEVPAVNMASNEVVNQDAGRHPRNANENDRVNVTGPVGAISSNHGSRHTGDGKIGNKLEDAIFLPIGNKEPDRIDPPSPLHDQLQVLGEGIRPASAHCFTNPGPRQPLHNQPEMLEERVRSASAHCSTNPPPSQLFPTTTAFPTIIEPEVANPFKMTLQPRSMALVEPPSNLVAKAKFHPIIFKDIEQQLGNLRAISSTCMSALELCTEKVVELNNGIVSLHQNRSQSGKDKQGSLDDDVNLEDNVSNIQAGFEKLRSITLLIHNSTHRIQRDIRDGLLQLNNSSGELTQATTQVGNEVSQVSAQLIQFRNRWEEQMEDIRSLVLVAEFLKQDAIERGQDVKSVKKSLQELKTEEAYLHNQSLGLNESIRHICEELRRKLDGVGSAVKDLHVDMASNFAKQDERGQRIETSVGELRNDVQNQFGEQKQTVERLATKVDELRKDFSCFTRTVIEMDDAMGNAEDELGSAGKPEEGQSSTVPPIRSSVNEGAVNIPASPGSNNIEVENLRNIGHPKLVAQKKNPRSKKKDKLEKATSSQRKPVAKVQAPKPEQKVIRKQITSKISRKNERPTKQQPTENGMITRSKRQRMLQQEEASAATLVGHQTRPNLCNDVQATASTVNVTAKKEIKRKKFGVALMKFSLRWVLIIINKSISAPSYGISSSILRPVTSYIMFGKVLVAVLMAIPMGFFYSILREGGSFEKAVAEMKSLPSLFLPMMVAVFGPMLIWLYYQDLKLEARDLEIKEFMKRFEAIHAQNLQRFQEQNEAEAAVSQSVNENENSILEEEKFFSEGYDLFEEEEEEENMTLVTPSRSPKKSPR
ncbi:unnamed protein product [Orchesella dallaii]|uniref:Uncharacterized protein n=1 Tax=Orchesella dallaii TaxID=48710 RepID=A0ABP1Q098_9HEXA